MKAKAGHEQETRRLLEELARYHREQPGYVAGYTLASRETGEVGRVSVWSEEAQANRVATTSHDLALRSELNLAVEPGSHRESSYEGVETPLAAMVHAGGAAQDRTA